MSETDCSEHGTAANDQTGSSSSHSPSPEPPCPEELKKLIHHKAIELLARREHSNYEMVLKLLLRFPHKQTEVAQVLDTLSRQGYQCDIRFAEQYTRMRLNKGFGPQRIAVELKQKGISDSLIAKIENSPENDEAMSLSRAWEKKFGNVPEDFFERAKQYKFLQYRGYNNDKINAFFSDLQNDIFA